MIKVSLFKNTKTTTPHKSIMIDLFLELVREGEWQDQILAVRTAKTAEEKKKLKMNLENITISGIFSERKDAGLEDHSGFIAIDIDDMNPEEVKEILAPDDYVYAIFTSCGGNGACVLFRINGDKHRQAFKGIQEYLHDKYDIVIDPTCINPSRTRYVSYDPHLWTNTRARKFAKYPKEKKIPQNSVNFVYCDNDFDEVMQQIRARRLNLCENYHDWLRIGFALASKFGENGREAFHEISMYSSKYESAACDRQYTNCLKGGGDGVSISTFFYYCKDAGLTIYSDKTKTIIGAANNSKRSGQSVEDAVKKLEKFEGIKEEDSKGIIEQVFSSAVEIKNGESLIHRLESWLKQDYALRRNMITRNIEMNDKQLSQTLRNDIYIEANKMFDNVSYEMLERVMNSSNTEDYNPFLEFIHDHAEVKDEGLIKKLVQTITINPESEIPSEHTELMITKWLVSMMASIHGGHSPLMLVLAGGQNTGKTEWFRRLLPKKLQAYFGEMQEGMKDVDEAIMLTQKLIVLDDEMAGKSKKEEIKLKSLLSKDQFTLREPYGRANVDLQRLAVLAGTTNNLEILSDPTGNRRILPIHVMSLNHEMYNDIDKDALFMEVYRLWAGGYKWGMTKEDVENLKEYSQEFQAHSTEAELISEYLGKPESEDDPKVKPMMASMIKTLLENSSGQRLSLHKLGQELKAAGFQQKKVKVDGTSRRCYLVLIKGVDTPTNSFNKKDTPFS